MKGGFYLKKILIILTILIIMFFISNNGSNDILIPNEAIRFRVIANSNSEKDQNDKKIIVNSLQQELMPLLKNDLEESRTVLKSNINNFKEDINKTISKNNINTSYTINYGINYFPEKIYKGVKYSEGNYESLVVTLGKGTGENFWCVLFPPLCLLEGEETKKDNIEYKSFVKEIIDKYF